MATEDAPRTLADQLRRWPDQRLAALLVHRPDLAQPTPQDTAQLASRAATRSSLLRALELLDRPALAVLEVLLRLGPMSDDRLAAVVHADPASVRASTDRLRDLAIVWGEDADLRALSAAADGLAAGQPGSTGLRPADPGGDPATVAQRLEAVGPEARALLTHLDEHGGEGTSGTARTQVGPDQARGPVEELLSRRLLLPRGAGTLVLPGDVAVVLRGGRTTTEPVDVPPEVATSSRQQSVVDRAAAGAAFEACRQVGLLLETWSTRPPGVLRTGGLGVRDLKATATLLQVPEPDAALLVEVAHEAGLLGHALDRTDSTVWAPTDAFDVWQATPVAEQWVALATAWLSSPRLIGLVGGKDRDRRTWNALSPELSGTYAAESRRAALEVLAALPRDQVLANGTGVASVVARTQWERPRRPASRGDQVAWALREGATLGITGLGGLSGHGRHLLDGDPASAEEALAPLLPEAVDHVLLQADLTAVAPGPLDGDLARRLHDVADVESRGGASVHRFTPASMRRALDAGWSAAEVHEFLAEVSRTPVPQALTFLVDDVARTHGSIRAGHAEAFLRADDESALAALLHHPGAASLGLRRLAPTVLISSTPLDVLLPRLRDLGAAPVVEAPDGSVHVARPDVVRARRPRRPRAGGAADAQGTARAAAAVTALRAGDRAVASRPPGAGTAQQSPAAALAALREAAETGSPVLISYVDNHGATTQRVVDPRRVDGGRLTAWDHRSDEVRTFAVHRITGVRAVVSD